MSKDGWFITLPGYAEKKGPYDTSVMEDFAANGMLSANSKISHHRYTKGRVVEARRIARFFNIFSKVSEEDESHTEKGLILGNASDETPPIVAAISKKEDDVGGIGRYMADGQDPSMIIKLVERVDGICTVNEKALYMAVQQRPVANFSPDAVVLTNRRAIIFRQKVLGRLQFVDVPWINVGDVHVSENIIGSTISIRGLNGHTEHVDYLPKPQARKIYRIAQEMEEKMVELRRERNMEEKRYLHSDMD